MKLKKDGFITIECIVSMSIICISMYIISTSLYNSYNLINNNQEQFKMLNIANEKIEEVKCSIKNNNLSFNKNIYSEKEEYDINVQVKEDTKYYQCYKISVAVSNNNQDVTIKGYVFKQ